MQPRFDRFDTDVNLRDAADSLDWSSKSSLTSADCLAVHVNIRTAQKAGSLLLHVVMETSQATSMQPGAAGKEVRNPAELSPSSSHHLGGEGL